MFGADEAAFFGGVDRTDGFGGLVESGVLSVHLDPRQKGGAIRARGQGVHQFLFDQVADHAFGFGTQHIEGPRVFGREACCLQRHQPDLRAVAMRHDDLMIAGQIGQGGSCDAHIGVLGFGGHRFATLQQGIAAQGHDYTHHAAPMVATRTALIACSRFSA